MYHQCDHEPYDWATDVEIQEDSLTGGVLVFIVAAVLILGGLTLGLWAGGWAGAAGVLVTIPGVVLILALWQRADL